MSYLVPVTGGTITVDAAVIQRTKRIGVLEAKVFGDGDRLVAMATGTFYIQAPKS